MVNSIDYTNWSEENLDTEVVNACSAQNYDLVKYLLKAQEKKKVCEFADYNTYFYMVCSNGDLPMVQWFVENYSQSLSSEYSKGREGKAFLEACKYGHIEVVNYLLNNETVKNIGDFSKHTEKGFESACINENIEIINYLLHDNIKRNPSKMNPGILDKELKTGLYYAALYNNHSMTELFIIDWNIQFDKGIEDYLHNLPNNIIIDAKTNIKNLYEKRELYKKLNHEVDNIENNNTNIIKKKI